MAEAESEAAEQPPAEAWIYFTQIQLGQLITKPRLLPDRLRKPPFRFLFDIVVEVARATNFGLTELFGGELAAKPAVPGSRDEKIAFLERWIQILAPAADSWAPGIANVTAQNIVCGVHSEWTNYLLQATAAASWPTRCYAPPLPSDVTFETPGLVPQEPVAAEQAVATETAVAAPEASVEEQAVPAEQAPPVEQALPVQTIAETPAPDPTPDVPSVEYKPLPEALPELVPVAPLPEQFGSLDEEKAKELAEGMDFAAALSQFGNLQEEFTRTTGGFRPATSGGPREEETTEVAGAQPDADEGPAAEGDDARPTTSAGVPLRAAAQKADKVGQEIEAARNLLDEIEAGLEEGEARIQQRREEEAQRKLDVEREAQSQADRIAAQAEAEAKAEEEREAQKAEAAAQTKAAKAAERARRRAEKEAEEAAELAAQQQFPQSKTSMAQGARMVASVGIEDEYEWDGDDDAAAAGGGAGQAASQSEGSLAAPASAPASGYVDSMSACFGEDILGPSKAAPDPFQADPIASLSSAALHEGRLFNQLKAELKDTFVSYLCASMPESLLKKYNNDELIGCLQMLLQELRKCIQEHGLQDVHDEEPTSLAEELRSQFPNDWLAHLQGASPWAMRSKYDVPELIDTLQGLMQTSYERLNDEIGPITMWAKEDSLLRSMPPMAAVQEPPVQNGTAELHRQPTWEDAEKASAEGPWSSALAPAPWEEELAAQAPPPTAGVRAAPHTATGQEAFKSAPLSPPPPKTASAAPVFNASLGPALWEQEALGGGATASRGPATAAPRMGTGVGGRAPTGGQRPMTMNRGFAVTSR